MVTSIRPVQRLLALITLGIGILDLGCSTSQSGVTIEPYPPIILTITSEPTLLTDNQDPVLPWVMTVNNSVQFHVTDPRTGNRVDDKVAWSVDSWKSTLDPKGAIDQTGKYVAPGQPSFIVLLVGTNAPQAYNGYKYIEIVAAPAITSLSASATTISAGQNTSLTPVFVNGQGKLMVGTSVVQATLISGTTVTVTPTATTTYTLVVTNLAGASVSQDLRITVQ